MDSTRLMNWPFPQVRERYDPDRCILYALGLGIGRDPIAMSQLAYVYEDGLKALPTMSVTLGFPGPWLQHPDTGVDYAKVVHAEQHCRIFRPLETTGTMLCDNRVRAVIDKGPGRGALVLVDRDLRDEVTNELVSRHTSVLMVRGAGGFGGDATAPATGAAPALGMVPDGLAPITFDWPTLPAQALIYRLSGDRNPLHADPGVAANAGFERPILHGLCSFGIAGYAAIELFCNGDPARLFSIGTRFSAPAFPGETLRFEFWRTGRQEAVFRARVLERDVTVLSGGRIEFANQERG